MLIVLFGNAHVVIWFLSENFIYLRKLVSFFLYVKKVISVLYVLRSSPVTLRFYWNGCNKLLLHLDYSDLHTYETKKNAFIVGFINKACDFTKGKSTVILFWKKPKNHALQVRCLYAWVTKKHVIFPPALQRKLLASPKAIRSLLTMKRFWPISAKRVFALTVIVNLEGRIGGREIKQILVK